MSEAVRAPAPSAGADPILDELIDEFARRLQRGEAANMEAYIDEHPELKRPFYHVPHRAGVAGTAAQFILHVSDRIDKDTRFWKRSRVRVEAAPAMSGCILSLSSKSTTRTGLAASPSISLVRSSTSRPCLFIVQHLRLRIRQRLQRCSKLESRS